MLHGQYKQCAVHWLIKAIGIEHKASFRRHGFRSSQWKNWPVRLFAAWTIQAMCCSLAYQNCVLFIGLSKPLALSTRQHLSCWLNVLDLLLSIDGSWVPSYQSWVSVRQLYLEIYITCNSLLALVIEWTGGEFFGYNTRPSHTVLNNVALIGNKFRISREQSKLFGFTMDKGNVWTHDHLYWLL